MNATPYADATPLARWDSSLLEPLAELNEEVLGAFLGQSPPGVLPAPGSLGWQWRGMAPEARRRVATCPFLLLDLGLARPGPWVAGGCQLGTGEAGVAEPAAMPLRLDAGLLHRALLYAWHLARAHRHAARIALGMCPASAEALAACRLGALERLAVQPPPWIRPRWADRPLLWQGWLAAAAHGREPELERLRLWGLQVLAAEVLRSRAHGPGAAGMG
jgi:hypothetical protein